MAEPLVCAIMLVHGGEEREEMNKRAARCYNAQIGCHATVLCYRSYGNSRSIGTIRNEAISRAVERYDPDVIAHFDSDDWSAPHRIAEQVKLLQESGADAIGYNEMFFADVRGGKCEAWRYKHPHRDYLIGTSLCYWRHVWERHPFMDLPIPGNPQSACEDTVWQSGLNCVAVPDDLEHPRMIATLHGGNTRLVIDERSDCWTRMPEWDEKLRTILEAA